LAVLARLLGGSCARPELARRAADEALDVLGTCHWSEKPMQAVTSARDKSIPACGSSLADRRVAARRGGGQPGGSRVFMLRPARNPRREWIACPRCPAATAGNCQSAPSRAPMLWPCAFESTLARFGPTSMRKPLSRPERDDRGTSQTSIRRHPPRRSAMRGYTVAPIQYRGVAMRHVGPRDAAWVPLPISTWTASSRRACGRRTGVRAENRRYTSR
jgi:hypothetical protein